MYVCCQECFDSFCKKVLKNHARNYEKQLRKYNSQECYLEDVSLNIKLQPAFSASPYEEAYIFRVMNMDIIVNDFLLGAALEKLNDDQRDIVLLSYFLEMTDQEIAECLNLIRRTVSYRRSVILKKLKKILEASMDEYEGV